MAQSRSPTYYELLGVTPDCSPEELRQAYRRMAWQRHPDVSPSGLGLGTMADINEAWRVLSNEKAREKYDESVRIIDDPPPSVFVRPTRSPAAPGQARARRHAWVAGLQAQMARLARQAGRSATQTLLVRNPRGPRSDYEAVVDKLVSQLSADTESRVRAARAAGAAPLDLGVAATLVGVRSVADAVRREASLQVTRELLMTSELLDRMWDVMAHELPVSLSVALGGNPNVAKAVRRHQAD
jgi:curved DNA-binding protein CbpA